MVSIWWLAVAGVGGVLFGWGLLILLAFIFGKEKKDSHS